jgi:14-3-3 protein epsilon
MSKIEEKPIYEKNIYMALLTHECGRYEEMFKFMEDLVIQRNKDLSLKEREFLTYGYINYIQTKRKALHMVMAYETKEKKKENSFFLMYIQEYRNKIELELTQSCQRICYILDSLLIKKAENIETKIFYRKLKGDLNRYVGEYAKDDLKEKVMKDGLIAYQEAIKMSKELPILNEVLLGLSLNMSLFYYEVMKETKKAIEISNECAIKIDKELPNFDATNENNKVIITLVNLIKDNLAHWKAEEAAEQSNNKKIINN